jgi:plasmid stabilization system protein ParE
MKYRISYLPVAERDLTEIIEHISISLSSPNAARDFLRIYDKKIELLATSPLAFPIYDFTQEFGFDVHYICVKSYMIFYVIQGDIIEIRRVVFQSRDMSEIDLDV